jgi:hypothetical protein
MYIKAESSSLLKQVGSVKIACCASARHLYRSERCLPTEKNEEEEEISRYSVTYIWTRLNMETHFKNGKTISLKIMTMQIRERLVTIHGSE